MELDPLSLSLSLKEDQKGEKKKELGTAVYACPCKYLDLAII